MLGGEDKESTESNLRALRELKDSRGWAILMETAKSDILSAALQMADNPTMTEKEMHFRRGAISATRNFVNVVDLLIASAESDILIASAEKLTQLPINATA